MTALSTRGIAGIECGIRPEPDVWTGAGPDNPAVGVLRD
jgi:hypothetical protein